MQTFTSLLALVAVGGAVLLAVARVAAPRVDVARRAGIAVADAAWWLAALVAVVATLGSLYFSEVADYTPCRLCWFQRIAMYPLAVVLPIAAARRDHGARWYVIPIAAIGAAVSTYHYVIEWAPSLEGGACSATGPACADIWFRELGFVTLAFMALCGFVSIILLLVVSATFDRVAAPADVEADRLADDLVPAPAPRGAS